jgi:hypothetical protein
MELTTEVGSTLAKMGSVYLSAPFVESTAFLRFVPVEFTTADTPVPAPVEYISVQAIKSDEETPFPVPALEYAEEILVPVPVPLSTIETADTEETPVPALTIETADAEDTPPVSVPANTEPDWKTNPLLATKPNHEEPTNPASDEIMVRQYFKVKCNEVWLL